MPLRASEQLGSTLSITETMSTTTNSRCDFSHLPNTPSYVPCHLKSNRKPSLQVGHARRPISKLAAQGYPYHLTNLPSRWLRISQLNCCTRMTILAKHPAGRYRRFAPASIIQRLSVWKGKAGDSRVGSGPRSGRTAERRLSDIADGSDHNIICCCLPRQTMWIIVCAAVDML